MAVFKRNETMRDRPVSTAGSATLKPVSTIGGSMVIKGRVRASEEVLVEGKVDGNIHVKHRVVIGKSGHVKADIEATEIVIRGRVDGNIKATAKVEIEPEGVLNGNITSQRVVLAEGAIFKGSIDMVIKEEKKPAVQSSAAGEGSKSEKTGASDQTDKQKDDTGK